ncbi:MAG: peptidoglycan-binding protein [Treponema sp.]|jgi:hypothetical protein|nr:peptidoglycan-binding protein [Treponema sp.]
MKCNEAIDRVYEGGDLPFAKRLGLAWHLLFCGRCAARAGRYEEALFLLSGSFPSSPDFEDALMARIYREAGEEEAESGLIPHLRGAGGFSTRSWVIVGLVVFLSFLTLFTGEDFASLALEQGSSYLLPLGITVGIFLTGYGALFIGSHLKELSEHFKNASLNNER